MLLDACRRYGIDRYHQVSTDEVYGDLPLDRPDLFFTEETNLKTSSPYSASKAGADLLVMAYHRTYKIPTTISRCSNNYGPYHFPEKLIPLMIINALSDKKLPVYGDGKNVRDWLYVEDHCRAIDLILQKGRVGEVYNIGGHNERANIDVVKTILKELGKPEDLIEHVGRMGSSPFEAASFEIELDEGCGMGFSAVHKVRAAACEALERAVLAPYAERVNHVMVQSDPVCPANMNDLGEVCALVTSLDAAAAARNAGAARVYMTVDDLLAAGLSPASCSAEGLIPVLDEVSRELDHERLDPWLTPSAPAAVGTISELALGVEIGSVVELRSCIPVHNVPCMRELAARGAHAAWLSPELTLAEIERIGPQRGEMTLGLMVLGAPRVMTSEHCILQVAGACIHDCANCRLRTRDFKLKNIDGRMLPVRTGLNGRSHLYDGVQLDATPQIPQLLRAGVTRFLVDGTLMSIDMLSRSVARTTRALEAARSGRTPDKRLPGTSSGCLFQGVE